MAQAVTVYRWDDPGAPQVVDGRPSEYLNILKKCLVEGYGSKTGLGWSVTSEDEVSPLLVVKNNVSVGGSGGYAMFSSPDNAAGQTITCRGLLDFVDRDNFSRSSPFFGMSTTLSAAALLKNWILIGTGKAFYFFSYNQMTMVANYTNTQYVMSFFMGDIDSLYPNDQAAFTSFSGAKNTTSTSWSYTLSYIFGEGSTRSLSTIYALDGTDSKEDMTIISLFSTVTKINGDHNGDADIKILSPCYSALSFGDLDKSAPFQNDVNAFIRGTIPGMFVASNAGYRNNVPPVIKNLGGTNYYLIPSGRLNTGCVWINLESW